MTLVAKPVIDKQYWILQHNQQKVGNVQAVKDGYALTVKGTVIKYKTIRMLRQQADIEFVTPQPTVKPDVRQVHGYHAGCRVYNPIWNVQMRLPLFTKQAKSKSWYAAGWYQVRQHANWKTVHNPKLITLQRYAYQGPFHSQKEAHEAKT